MWCCCNLVGRGGVGVGGSNFFHILPNVLRGWLTAAAFCDVKLVVCAKRPIWGLSPASLIAFRIFPALSAVTGRVHLGQRVLWEYHFQILCQMCVFVGCQEIGRVCTVWFFFMSHTCDEAGTGGEVCGVRHFLCPELAGSICTALESNCFSSVTSDIHV